MTADLIYKDEYYAIVGAAMEVHRQLGPGLSEAIYHEAMLLELQARNIPFETEKELNIFYKGQQLKKTYKADIYCYDKIIVELKACEDLITDHEAQIINYLKITGCKLGILINFGTQVMQHLRYANTYKTVPVQTLL